MNIKMHEIRSDPSANNFMHNLHWKEHTFQNLEMALYWEMAIMCHYKFPQDFPDPVKMCNMQNQQQLLLFQPKNGMK